MADELLLNLAITVAALLGLWLVAIRLRDVSFIDAVWGLGMAALAMRRTAG